MNRKEICETFTKISPTSRLASLEEFLRVGGRAWALSKDMILDKGSGGMTGWGHLTMFSSQNV
jgi:hypothetical protein